MTVGFWYEEAQRAMRAATAAVTRRRAGTAGEINGLVGARSDLYHQLARVTELLVGGRPVAEVPDKAAAALVLGRHGQSLTRFYVGLRAAAVVNERLPPAPEVSDGAARSLRRAADAIGVMGDIIAGHVPPGRRPDTPEGIAIRAGGGVQGGLGDIARLAVDAVRLDGRLPAWLDRGGPLAQTYRPAAEAARWTSGSRLGAVAKELIAAAKAQPDLRELDIARSPQHPAQAVDTVDAAIAAVRAARTWLWLHPDQVTGAHLQVGTQLGLTVHILRTDGSLAMIGGWRQAAIAAAELRAAPAAGPGQDAAAELGEALRWTRSLLNPGVQGRMPHRVREATRLGSEMLLMAATLHRGLRTAMQRRNLFVRGDAVLERPVGSLVYRATPRWRPATVGDDLVRDLSRALWQIIGSDAEGDPASMVAHVLAQPPRPRAVSPAAAESHSPTPDVPQDDRARSVPRQGEGRQLNPAGAEKLAAVLGSEAVEEGGEQLPGEIAVD
ncbi:hypothetical protein [Micromonospora aurantiaca]|uniref:hypothetical protein n=1 Tax=Micromonospora aurantiaca (nom. illeg.) TaxID=47850 RepID=UPI0011A702E8|nr:hypothetical protein [Micromonospora aurantiaca]UFN92703.1 hypothetical protein LF814_22230 [Micromonospora aurantiaca]